MSLNSALYDVLEGSFRQLSIEAEELYLSKQIPVLDCAPTPLEFYRDWVSPNKPVVIRNITDSWAALNKWTPDYLRSKIGSHDVTVAVTPSGYADAVFDDKFVMPEERLMQFAEFLDILFKKRKVNGVFYVQKQNSNLTDEFADLIEEAASEISWATESFGKSPDAVNFWMGDERAITSMHKDPYENLYCVVSGFKIFTLLPPTDQPYVPYKVFPAAKYKENEHGEFQLIPDKDTGEVPWIDIDPMNPDLVKYPQYSLTHPVHVKVSAGETLYLPSLWFHHVQQSHGCIAVNFWYDMEYDIKYNYYKFVESLLQLKDQ